MTNNIYPPDYLLRKWEELIIDEEQNVDVVLYEAFQAGADQELEACVNYVDNTISGNKARALRAARRPKPPSLKEQALQALYRFDDTEGHDGLTQEQIAEDFVLIRRALESLPD